MAENFKSFDSLLEKVEDYGKTSIELLKLKALDKTSDMVSSLAPYSVIYILVGFFLLFFNIGIALWLGELLEKPYYGFLVVAAFYGVTGIIVQLFMQKWIKKMVCNKIIKQVLN